MAIEIKMPALSPTMEEGTLARWLVAPGALIKPGDLVAEIETEKATMEFEAADAGVLDRILVPEGREVAVGTVIAILRGAAEGAAQSDEITTPTAVATDVPESQAQASPSQDHAQVVATPLARRIAQARGVSLEGMIGTGAHGKIVKDDVLPSRPSPGSARDSAQKVAVIVPTTPHEVVKLSSMRRTIARRLTEAKATVPHFYVASDIRLDSLLALRAELNSLGPESERISVNDFLLKALALALTLVPEANVQFADDCIYRFTRVDIAMAVAIDGGLLTPVIVDAASMSVAQISKQAKALALRAREGRLHPEEYQGGTASLSNLGMFGVSEIVPVLNPPQGMILGVGAGERKPVIQGDEIVVGTMLRATGSFDHRAIDGAVAARLMQTFRSVIETPLKLLT
jgi:pyruvate dehydrogenase E2 component (dihydrolipoamide acetyltransferase)